MNAKEIAAATAVTYIKEGMTLGLGTGSTAFYAIERIGRMVAAGMDLKAVASSVATAQLALEARIPMVKFSEVKGIDIYIDGADEVDKDLNLIKGGGGALAREKILAFHSDRFIVIADNSKMVDQLGRFPLAVEVLPFANEFTRRNLEKMGCSARIRTKNEVPFITDNGNLIMDCAFDRIEDPGKVGTAIREIPGVVEHGLFSRNLVDKVIVGYENGDYKEFEVAVNLS